jgi:hypothetical protein
VTRREGDECVRICIDVELRGKQGKEIPKLEYRELIRKDTVRLKLCD